jgi:hypothetical protein
MQLPFFFNHASIVIISNSNMELPAFAAEDDNYSNDINGSNNVRW